MKKILSLLLVLTLVCMMLPLGVHAAASASLSGPDVVRPGDTITLSFVAGGGIYGGNGSISYDASQLTLQGYSASLSNPWAVEFNGNNFIFYDNSMASPISGSKTVFTATFQVSASVQPGSTISVSANGIVLSDGSADSSIGSRTYSVTVAQPLSSNANLASLTVSNASIYPGFSADHTSYSCSVPYTTSSLDIAAAAEHAGATVAVYNNSLVPGTGTYVTVTVTAETGTTKSYYIYAERAQDPNYVPSAVNTLESLQVSGFSISPAFSPDKTDYAVYLPYETDTLNLTATVTDSKSEASLPSLEGIPVGQTLYEIPVTAENGDMLTYTLTVFRADVFPPEETVPEETEPVTEPTEPATEPTVAPTTEPATEPTTEPTTPPTTQPAPSTEEPKSMFPIFWILGIIAAFAAGCALTALLIKRKAA